MLFHDHVMSRHTLIATKIFHLRRLLLSISHILHRNLEFLLIPRLRITHYCKSRLSAILMSEYKSHAAYNHFHQSLRFLAPILQHSTRSYVSQVLFYHHSFLSDFAVDISCIQVLHSMIAVMSTMPV